MRVHSADDSINKKQKMTSKRKESKRPKDLQTRATLNSTHAHNKSIDLRSERKTATERNTCGGRG